jgi:hypothetical protein
MATISLRIAEITSPLPARFAKTGPSGREDGD